MRGLSNSAIYLLVCPKCSSCGPTFNTVWVMCYWAFMDGGLQPVRESWIPKLLGTSVYRAYLLPPSSLSEYPQIMGHPWMEHICYLNPLSHSQSIRGYPSYLWHLWIGRICYLHPLSQSIHGYPEYPRIPKLLRVSMDTQVTWGIRGWHGTHLLPPSPLSAK